MTPLYRRLTGAVTLGVVLLLGGCGLAEFDVERDIAEQRVAGNVLSGLLDTFLQMPVPMNVDISQETASRDTGPASGARLSALTFSITPTAEEGSDTDDFGFLESVSVFVESTRSGSSLPRALIAEVVVTEPQRTLRFTTFESVDLLPYADEGSRFVSEARGSVPPDDVTFAGQFVVTIELL